MNNLHRFVLAGVAVGSLAISAQGAVIAQYAFDGSVDTSSDAEANSLASPLTLSSSLTGSTATPATSSPGFSAAVPSGGGTNSRFVRTYVTPNSQAAAVANNAFVSFTVTPDSGYAMNLSSVTASIGATGLVPPNLTINTTQFFLRSSLDGFASNIDAVASVSSGETSSSTGGVTVWTNASWSLASPSFQSVGGPVTFRLYLFDNFDLVVNGANSFSGVNRFDNVRLNGELVVPEPASLSLLAAAGVLGLRRRSGR